MKRNRRKSYRWGHVAEFACCALLLLKGYRILHRRYRTRHGEVDIVARKGKRIVFVEVKARPTLAQGLEANTPRQRRRIEQAAQSLMRHPSRARLFMRFDMMVARPWRLPYHLKDAWRP
jgi:putative endonuclease